MTDASYSGPGPFEQDLVANPPSDAVVQPNGRLRITIGAKPLEVNGGSPGGATGGTAPAEAPGPFELALANAGKPKVSAGDALVTGLKQGLSANFSDELAGVNAASGLPDIVKNTVGSAATLPVGIARLAYEHASGQPGEATKAFNDAVAQARQEQQQAQEQHPIASTVGNIGGALATSLLPVGAAAQGASMGGRAAVGGLTSGAYGALYGAGEGEGLEDRTQRAVTGGLVGLGLGVAAPPLLAGASAATKFVSNKVGSVLGHPIQALQAARNLDQTATERVAGALKYDAENGQAGMTGADVAAAQQHDQPVMLADLGGPATQETARAAANSSPAARGTLEGATQGRFTEQAKRVKEFVQGLGPGGGNATRTQAEIDAAQVKANGPAYKKAYAAGDRPINSPELETLMGSPDVVSAMKTAAEKGKSRAIADGMGAFNSGVKVTDDGRVIFNKGKNGVPTYPNIQFWDYTYRSLRDAGSAAFRAGRNDEGSYLSDLAKQLKSQLDKEVPEYADARAGAAKFFGAENALEAGQKFLTSKQPIAQAQAAYNKMSAGERALFAEGFVSKLADAVSQIPNNRNVVISKIFNSDDGAARIKLALGPERAAQLESFLRREDMMDMARKAVTGNSSTVRQLIMKNLANAGAHGAVGAGVAASVDEILNGNLDWKHVLMGGMLAGTGVATTAVNAKLAQSIAEKLVSDDPKVVNEVLRIAAGNPKVAGAIRNGEAFLQKLVGTTVGNHPPMLPPPTGAMPAAANQQQQQ